MFSTRFRLLKRVSSVETGRSRHQWNYGRNKSGDWGVGWRRIKIVVQLACECQVSDGIDVIGCGGIQAHRDGLWAGVVNQQGLAGAERDGAGNKQRCE